MPDSRQRVRAPFAHQSSSTDLTSGASVASLRSPPAHQNAQSLPPWSSTSSAPEPGNQPYRAEKTSTYWGSSSMGRKDSNDLTNGNYADNPYSLNVPSNGYLPEVGRRPLSINSSRASSPGPFSIPQFTFPGYATIRFVSLCFLWYTCSAVSNNTGKVILNNFKYPVTLTIVQFFFVAACCIVCSRKELGWTPRLRSPTKAILRGILPMAAFQVGGHIFGSMAISRVPVSTVHTIKALSPLFTVATYAVLFGVSYSPATYLSLLPLTLGVMLASSADISFSNFFGLICALGSTLVFVSQNIFFKKMMPTPGTGETANSSHASHKLDKINLLYFSSGMAFLLMIPVWIYSDAWRLLELWLHPVEKTGGPSIPFYFFLNGTVHFAQNLLAFSLLSSTSPVTYSIASLVKRIAVICLAIIWFKQSVFFVQAVGIALTAVGLWMYNNAKRDVEKGEKKMRQVEAVREGMLPTTKADQRILEGRAQIDPMALGKTVHSSPKPTYPPNYIHLPSSTSTAIKPNGFSLPPSATAPPSAAVGAEASYPSPPASNASSPPTEPHHGQGLPRQRRMSNEGQQFRLPPAASARAPTINEEGNENKDYSMSSSMDGSKVGVVA
ncbi:solute carrier family 35, member E1 [Kwoniella heveanensis CBS 569]|nr:solute carrier family 35, member E1 [Kwoniella heveanensis CBS 569]